MQTSQLRRAPWKHGSLSPSCIEVITFSHFLFIPAKSLVLASHETQPVHVCLQVKQLNEHGDESHFMWLCLDVSQCVYGFKFLECNKKGESTHSAFRPPKPSHSPLLCCLNQALKTLSTAPSIHACSQNPRFQWFHSWTELILSPLPVVWNM